ncbi:MAG TPA: proline dehydrogenase family protein [Candidatus Dormibacteraeota bacterium]|nr:proline dehydrogenase family protein [Candidatus Dormibacteraeota bacterium]
MRAILLWCAQNQWLAAHVPHWGFARRAVRRFLPGEGFDSALKAAIDLQAQGVGSLFTRLGENVKSLEEANAVVEHYEEVLAASAGVGAEISVKPTQLGLDIDAGQAFANLGRLAAAAAKAKSFLWIDMEGSPYTDVTLDLYTRVHAEHPDTGVCLQAYLHRTVADIAKLLAHRPAIRLVKGAYAEPASIAFTAKRDVDANYLALCVMLLPELKRKKLRLVLGTHDVDLVARTWRFAEALGIERSQLEVNMLYGIRTGELVRFAREGFAVRDLIAYGDAWYAWYLRRLAERPANVLFVARQMLP